MWLSSRRPRYLNYSVNKKSTKSWEKLKKAIKTYEKLLKREKREGETLWIRNAINFASARLKRYWINPDTIKA